MIGRSVKNEAEQAQRYLYFAHAGAAGLLGLAAAYALSAPDFVKGLLVGMLLVFVLVLFRRRMRDEYIERLWNAGTAYAFIVTIILTIFGDFARGMYDGYQGLAHGATPPLDAGWVGLAALAAFYIGFHIEMWRQR